MNNSAISTLIVVLPCYNEEEVLNETAKELSDHIRNLIARHIIDSKSKICFVNDGSKDSTWSLIQKLCAEDSLVWGINLAHNRGHQNALLAGLFSVKEYADCVITMDADLQHDIYAIEDFIEKYREGNDIVYGVRKKRMYESFVKKIFSSTYYKIMSYFGAELIPESADYRLMSKKAISALMEYKESNLFLRGIIPTIGLPHSIVEYEQKERIKISVQKDGTVRHNRHYIFDRQTSFIHICGRRLHTSNKHYFIRYFLGIKAFRKKSFRKYLDLHFNLVRNWNKSFFDRTHRHIHRQSLQRSKESTKIFYTGFYPQFVALTFLIFRTQERLRSCFVYGSCPTPA